MGRGNVAWVLVVAWSTAGCGSRSPLRCPATQLDAAALEHDGPDAAAPTGTCHTTLRVDSTAVPFGCVIDLRVGHVAVLTYPCEGGAASASFDDAGGVFAGTVGADGTVALALDTRFRPGDGCVWLSHQTITGSLGRGALAYAYTEQPAPGERGCLPPCPVSTAVVVATDAGAPADPGSASAGCASW